MSASLTTVPKLTGDLAVRADAAMRELTEHERVGIAYSGGVDSATLAALAVRALGAERVVALLGVSPSLARRERQTAHEVAKAIGVPVQEIQTHEGERPEYIANDVDRCFFCKDELFTRIEDEVLDELDLDAVAYGENADDAKRPDRPGAGAATNHAVLRPLASAGLTKSDVREVARALGVPVADKPAAPCLASRIPHGEKVTPEKLRQVEDLEDAVFDLGFSDCRVRHHGRIARIEVPQGELPRAVEPETRAALVNVGRKAGFRNVTLDLAGLQSGAFTLSIMNAKGTL
ncbi:TIGR00268 family protein [Dermabacter vaginalis]|uniref:TIGR00268 family protein n=1 Tax=Dermabacter vaginalis TaxID=1630135 RepID=A0A1B0ZFZ4_9MICO|nr:ATP-dependent sacrificial sulfur transferase LarE [Dermabacter vaginalis]ANP26885.1 TIGR00268 family protein [Dermabacter vaginalis]